MRCVVGIDLGSTTTKAVLLDEQAGVLGQGITNSRSNYEVACAVALEEARVSARMSLLRRALEALPGADAATAASVRAALEDAFRLELYLDELAVLREEILGNLDRAPARGSGDRLEEVAVRILDRMAESAPAMFLGGERRRSDFFRDLAGASFMAEAERAVQGDGIPFERLAGLFDRAILAVEARVRVRPFGSLLRRAAERIASHGGAGRNAGLGPAALEAAIAEAADRPLDEAAFVGTGYGRQTLPFPKEAIRSEILCHGRGAHAVFPMTRTVLDIGGQDTKAIQVEDNGVVTSFQMNDRCAAGCGRYLGYIADELNMGLHELGPLALQARKKVRVNSTCTVFAGAELRERLALGQRREDILAGLHRAMMLRAMSLLARSGGVSNEMTFTGGVCKNPMATRILGELVAENYGDRIQLNLHPDSIYMGARGAALFALDDLRAARAGLLPSFASVRGANGEDPPCGGSEPSRRWEATGMDAREDLP
jgi:benzoyl-CoA reductase subunit A